VQNEFGLVFESHRVLLIFVDAAYVSAPANSMPALPVNRLKQESNAVYA
jgi:hypothetical protein